MNLLSPTKNKFDTFFSHPNKPLRLHMEGVLEGTKQRSASYSCARIAALAALFHDVGKLNPNFQAKINPIYEGNKGAYSSHAYLSAFAFICYCSSNDPEEEIGLEFAETWQVLALVAHHHGHLPNFEELLSAKEREKVLLFLADNPFLPISNFLQQWMSHEAFDVCNPNCRLFFTSPILTRIERKSREHAIKDRLDYFLDTQFSFASLIEADKRDAGNNKYFRRPDQIIWAKEHFQSNLENHFSALKNAKEAETPLNLVRTQLRNEAVEELRKQLSETDSRVFSLTAPTGAGKTYTLLALAGAIREKAPNHAIIYGLPFLTITEQVENECREIFDNDFVTRYDSRTSNPKLDALLSELDNAPNQKDKEKLQELLREAFSSETFDAAFTVTTFVQIFETLLSNRNATLLKLPNFSKTIFLLDEIQALPPRLYTFFAAYLQAFCRKFDSYAIFSTATMPAFNIRDIDKNAKQLFQAYDPPKELLSNGFYQNKVFDRYEIRPLQKEPVTREELAQQIIEMNSSALVVLNTIEDSCKVFQLLDGKVDAKVLLLNTHFTLRDRQEKLNECKVLLKDNQRVILVSTQLIEAGVDIDFPMVFRDLCPLPNLVQTAGRGNRNGKKPRARIWFFELKTNGESRAGLVYRNEPHWFLNFSREEILNSDGCKESELLLVQQKYFRKISHDLILGNHRLFIDSNPQSANLVLEIDSLAFNHVGSFRLIDKDFGESFRYFVPWAEGEIDNRFEELQQMVKNVAQAKREAGGKLPYQESRQHDINIQSQLQRLAPDIVQFRVPYGKEPPASAIECCGISLLAIPEDYSSETGISFEGSATAIL